MKAIQVAIVVLIFYPLFGQAQDTFSIVALDSVSRQVGSAGASCLDLDFAGIGNPAFLTDLLPDSGAINTQSYFVQANQDNARARMRLGETPSQIIAWLVANDANNNPEFKQYGIVGFQGIQASSASHSGTTCIDFKGQRNGSINGFHYAIQGNILKGPEILDSMESRFRNTEGPLACRLMAALQGAKIVGADTRCNTAGTSSLFAFLQLAQPNDVYGNPSLSLGLKTHEGDGIEPIDSLQILFDAAINCNPLSLHHFAHAGLLVYPNPVTGYCMIDCPETLLPLHVELNDFAGVCRKIIDVKAPHVFVDIRDLPKGLYIYRMGKDQPFFRHGYMLIE